MIKLLKIDRRPSGWLLAVWLCRRTTARPIAKTKTVELGGRPLRYTVVGARFAVVIMRHGPRLAEGPA